MKSEFIFWANYNGLKVYTDKNRTFSFTENIMKEVYTVLKRGYPLQLDNGEFITLAENIKLKNTEGDTTFKGVHSIYIGIGIN
jgi:hypothetical protein